MKLQECIMIDNVNLAPNFHAPKIIIGIFIITIKVPNVIGIILVKITAAPVKPPGAKLLGSKNIEIPTAYIQAAKVITIYLHMNFAIFFCFFLIFHFQLFTTSFIVQIHRHHPKSLLAQHKPLNS